MCNENKSCITINCGCCGDGLSEEPSLLFDGTMNTEGKTYELMGKVTDYRFLIVESGMHHAANDYWNSKYEFIYNPIVSDNFFQYSLINHVSVNGRNFICWHFPTDTSMYIDVFDKMEGGFDDLRIGKIYGIK